MSEVLKESIVCRLSSVVKRHSTFDVRRPAACVVFFSLCLHLAAFQPSFEIAASATNLIVTEQTAITLRLRMPGLGDPFVDQPPFLNQRPPHMEAEIGRAHV